MAATRSLRVILLRFWHTPYVGAIAECWHMYSEILGREYTDPEYFKVHRITVDAYSTQHIGNQEDRRASQSANLHLIALYLLYQKKAPHAEVLHFLRQTTAPGYKENWPAMQDVQNPRWMTVQDIIGARDAEEHARLVTTWGQSVWDAYAATHDTIAATYQDWLKKHS